MTPRCSVSGLLKVTIPASRHGTWEIRKFRVGRNEAKLHQGKERLRSIVIGGPIRAVAAGAYTKLCETTETFNEGIWMSDTPAECVDHLPPVKRATGDVLINGLGLGLVLKNVLAKREVTRVVVVEKSPDVIALVAPHFAKDRRLEVVEADAFEYEPRERFDVVWHDVWAHLDQDYLPEMERLKAKYADAGWQGCWSEPDVIPRVTYKPDRDEVNRVIREVGPVVFRSFLREIGIEGLRAELVIAGHFGVAAATGPFTIAIGLPTGRL